MSDLAEILQAIDTHHKEYPSHGLDCACMDKYIQKIRMLLKSSRIERAAQSRIHYVVRKAIERC